MAQQDVSLRRGSGNRENLRTSLAEAEANFDELYAGIGAGVNAQTGTTYTLVLTDAGKDIKHTNAAATNITVPPSASVAWVTGTKVNTFQMGAGQVTFVAGDGVTINFPASLSLAIKEQYGVATLTYFGSNVWVLTGLLEEAA
jgi:hypothetical protein